MKYIKAMMLVAFLAASATVAAAPSVQVAFQKCKTLSPSKANDLIGKCSIFSTYSTYYCCGVGGRVSRSGLHSSINRTPDKGLVYKEKSGGYKWLCLFVVVDEKTQSWKIGHWESSKNKGRFTCEK